jgi:POT family proton-dependent oligopeptide transporter
LFAGQFDNESITANPGLLVELFGLVVKITLIAGAVVLIFSKPIRKLMGDVR